MGIKSSTVSQHSSSSISSIKGIEKAKKKYKGSGLQIYIRDLEGVEIADFVLEGDEFDNISEFLITAIKNSLVFKKILLEKELKDIKEIL